jgi:hypothetical protein
VAKAGQTGADGPERRKRLRTRVLRDAAAKGFWLARRRRADGEQTWTWLGQADRDAPPRFPSRREAIDYMRDKLHIE